MCLAQTPPLITLVYPLFKSLFTINLKLISLIVKNNQSDVVKVIYKIDYKTSGLSENICNCKTTFRKI